MWIYFIFISAAILGLYEIAKKHAVTGNAVMPVLAISTAMGSLLFLPGIAAGAFGSAAPFAVRPLTHAEHGFVILKSCIVAASWLFGYFGLKRLPISVAAPVGTMGPVFTIFGSLLFFHERLTPVQWTGLGITLLSYFFFSRVSSREGIIFRNNKWIVALALAALFNATSTLYDKFVIPKIGAVEVQAWFMVYTACIMAAACLIFWYPSRKSYTKFTWRWSILLISLLLAAADFTYFRALSYPESLIAIAGPIRRCNILISFTVGGLLFHEVNLRRKGAVMLMMVAGVLIVFLGSHR